jgi:hypothetical protein
MFKTINHSHNREKKAGNCKIKKLDQDLLYYFSFKLTEKKSAEMLHVFTLLFALSRTPAEWQGRAIYQVLTDRFEV